MSMNKPDMSMLLSYNLEAEGFTVDWVERGDEAEGALLVLDAHPLLREYFAWELSRAASRGLAHRPPAALRAPLRDNEG